MKTLQHTEHAAATTTRSSRAATYTYSSSSSDDDEEQFTRYARLSSGHGADVVPDTAEAMASLETLSEVINEAALMRADLGATQVRPASSPVLRPASSRILGSAATRARLLEESDAAAAATAPVQPRRSARRRTLRRHLDSNSSSGSNHDMPAAPNIRARPPPQPPLPWAVSPQPEGRGSLRNLFTSGAGQVTQECDEDVVVIPAAGGAGACDDNDTQGSSNAEAAAISGEAVLLPIADRYGPRPATERVRAMCDHHHCDSDGNPLPESDESESDSDAAMLPAAPAP